MALLAGVLTLWGLTRNGYANTYYAEAAQAASRSWRAWITNALDVSGSDSVDKGPLPNMLMGLSGRVLGFSSFSLLLGQALCGVASVVVLHDVTRRTLGPRTAILAALMLALTPVLVAIGRFDNPDAVLVGAEVCAGWALVRALQSGRTRHVLLCGLFVGLAFNAKMLQAYLIVPGLALALLVAGRGSVRRRVGQLAAGAGAMLVVSFAWYATMMAIPAAQRPWVGDTADNSWFTLIFGYNGLDRVSGGGGGPGPGGGGGFGGPAGPLRLFDAAVGGQIAWLLPCAAAGLVLGLWARRRAPRTDLARAAYLLWGGWGLVSWAVFSFSRGIFHPYYTSALAPAVAVLAAACLTLLWDRCRGSAGWTVAPAMAAFATMAIGTAVLAAVLLYRTSGFLPWLAPTVIGLAALCVMALALARALRPAGGALTGLAAVAGLLAVLAGPASYSIATVGETLSGTNPLGGPSVVSGSAIAFAGLPARGLPSFPGGASGPPPGPPGGGESGRGSGIPFWLASGAASGRPRGGGLAGGALGLGRANRLAGAVFSGAGATVGAATISYLERHEGRARYLVAAVGSAVAGPIALSSGRDVIDMGGFTGSDPVPSLAALEHLVATGQLYYVLLSGRSLRHTSNGRGHPEAGDRGHPEAGPSGGAALGDAVGPGGPGATSSVTRGRDRWIESHGTAVRVPGQGETGLTLYRLGRS